MSIRPIRKYWYEAFYFIHVTLVLYVIVSPVWQFDVLIYSPSTFLIVAYFHTKTPGSVFFNLSRLLTHGGHSFQYYIWPVWVVWGFERLVRLLRYITLNYILRPSTAPFDATIAVASPSSTLLEITVTRNMPFGWRPGQHAFLAFPGVSTVPLESHPFTIASIPSGGPSEQLRFLIRVKTGATLKLLKLVQEQGKASFRAFIDGPYGMPPDLGPYRTTVLVAGGTGVTYTLPLLLDLVK